MKTKEELNALNEEIETVNKKLAELTEDELAQVSGGRDPGIHTRHFIYPVVIESDVRWDTFDVSQKEKSL